MVTGDFNGDGRTDLAQMFGCSWCLPVAFSNVDGTFNITVKPINTFGGLGSAPDLVPLVGEFNGDGLSDLAMTGAAGWTTLPVALSNGDGTFRVTNTTITNFGGWAATPKAIPLVGDFNDDGRADMALTGASGWNFVAVAFSNGDGSFTVTNITNAMTTILRQDRISGAPNAVLDSKVVTASMATTRNHVLNKADSRMIRRLLNTNP